MTIPLEEGFTVVTGPNGSGKSNILDGVLFCLGLANSRGMRADRLPDLVNSGRLRAGKAAETEVSVRFDLTDWQPDSAEEGLEPSLEGPWIKPDQKEWVVTRRLRVMPGGSYSSSYSADGEPCNLQQLQTQLRRLRIDPEGSNVVMQGDVTRIVSMSNRDRRVLIDELAGVALFDNRIQQTRSKLESVQERQERCRIVEQELLNSKQRLEKDCAKARTYQELKENYQLGKQQELVLAFEAAHQHLDKVRKQHYALGEQEKRDSILLKDAEKKLVDSAKNLSSLQNNVKALGEDKLINVQAEIAGADTQFRELERQAENHKREGEKLQQSREVLLRRRKEVKEGQDKKLKQFESDSSLAAAEIKCTNAAAAVDVSRRRLGDVAGRSGAWFEDQRKRTALRQKIESTLLPLQQEQQKLEERLRFDASREKELELEQERDIAQNQEVLDQLDRLEQEWKSLVQQISTEKKQINEVTETLSVQQRTRSRLEQEQTNLEREIARLESRSETLQESRGIGALRLLLEAGLEGIHGHVAHLGDVEDCHRLALEVAAGSRLGQIVVDDDRIAAKAIELLKKRKAGRLTFLPLNRIHTPGNLTNNALRRGDYPLKFDCNDGLVGRAIELVRFESIYKDVFAYVFGSTLVYKDLKSARIQLGKTRAVTLDGELLEKSGAMTGGSFSGRSTGFNFGIANEFDDADPMRKRLLELGETLIKCRLEENNQIKYLEDRRPLLRTLEQRQAALDAERITSRRSSSPLLERSKESSERLNNLQKSQENYQKRLKVISSETKPLIKELQDLNNKEALIGKETDSENWRHLQVELQAADEMLSKARVERDEYLQQKRQFELEIERLEGEQKSLLAEENLLQEAVQTLAKSHKDWREQNLDLEARRKILAKEQKELQEKFGEQRRARDAAEADVANQRQKLQEAQWKFERLHQDRDALEEEIRSSTIRLQELEEALPKPAPNISEEVKAAGLEQLQADLVQLQNQMEALEPVNMLALDELTKLDERLCELVERLEILSEERSELLLRIETVGTLRQEAFLEAFEAVDGHFREIFASLSDGDGHLQLDNSDDPLEGGLTLVAHPKGKSVRRLAAMSGGEKSLTALSFLFALQRFRPSPFYALDEVDSFLDGVNVERLSALIACQAEQAQFLVVSHRRPMISASSRTIGVTQARGAHTQVVGLPNAA